MLWALAVLFLICWILGIVGSIPIGGSVNIMLLLAALALLIGIVRDRDSVA
ncbi:MAG: DUF5670 family protein [Terriglobales bacterium]